MELSLMVVVVEEEEEEGVIACLLSTDGWKSIGSTEHRERERDRDFLGSGWAAGRYYYYY